MFALANFMLAISCLMQALSSDPGYAYKTTVSRSAPVAEKALLFSSEVEYVGTAAPFAFGLLAAIPVSSSSKLFHSSYACAPERYNLSGDPATHRGVLDRFFRWDSDKQIEGREGRQDFGDVY